MRPDDIFYGHVFMSCVAPTHSGSESTQAKKGMKNYSTLKKNFSLMVALWLTCVSNVFGAESIPAPTAMQKILESADSVMISSKPLGELETDDSSIVFTSVTVRLDDDVIQEGLKINLSNRVGSEYVGLEAKLVSNFLAELAEIGRCEQFSACGGYFGIARCRPSQPEPQAYCMENFSFSETEYGVLFRTPINTYRLVQVKPSDLIELVNSFDKTE